MSYDEFINLRLNFCNQFFL